MKLEIKKICVIGSGVMGSGISALFANADIEVVLLDIPSNEANRNSIADLALQKIEKNIDLYFDNPELIKKINTGNIEDNLEMISDCDFVIEAIIEDISKKQELYSTIEPYLKENAIIASNTSTIKIKDLCSNMASDLKKRFFITHFFNPPKALRLLEIVENQECNIFYLKLIKEFFSNKLNRIVIECKDSAGFIGNRIGFFYLVIGISEALSRGIRFELIDKAISKIFLIPKSGIFGLVDLIGIDVFIAILESFKKNLDDSDEILQHLKFIPYLKNMIKKGFLGRKSGIGFYKFENKQKLVLQNDFETYAPIEEKKFTVEISNLSKKGDEVSECAKYIIFSTINYAASAIEEIAYDLESIDVVMKEGYGWEIGPFEILDLLSTYNKHDKNFICDFFDNEKNLILSEFLKNHSDKKIYLGRKCLNYYGEYVDLKFYTESINLLKISSEKDNLFLETDSCSLVDLGDKVCCFNLKRSLIDFDVLDSLDESIKMITSSQINCIAFIIASENKNFCFGADLKFFKNAIKNNSFDKIEKIIEKGNKVFKDLNDMKIPVVCAVSGYAVGGGCEIILNSDFVVAKHSSFIGLSESNVGLIPGWGGIKSMLLKTQKELIEQTIANIVFGKISKTAEEAREMFYLSKDSVIIEDKADLMCEAKKLAISKSRREFLFGSIKIEERLDYYEKAIENFLSKIDLDEDKARVGKSILNVCKNIIDFEEYQLENFLLLIKNPRTLELIEKAFGDL